MSSKINEKLGLNPKTRTRQATHGRLLLSAARCPTCGSQHVHRTESRNGQRLGAAWCGQCSAFFTPTVAA